MSFNRMPGSMFGKAGNTVKARFMTENDKKLHIAKAIYNRHIDRLEYYVGLLKNPDSLKIKYDGSTFLNKACDEGNYEAFDFLIQHGAKIDNDSLVNACLGGNLEIIRRILASGIKVDQENSAGLTPLLAGLLRSNDATVEELLRSGANVNVVMRKNTSMYKLSKFDIPTYEIGTSPLMMAARNINSVHSGSLLLEHGATVDWISSSGITALMIASQYNNLGFVNLLIDNGADTEILDEDDRNAFLHSRSKDVSKVFLDSGENIDRQDKNGSTALMLATKLGNLDLVKFLLENNADTGILDNEGNDVRHYTRDSMNMYEFNRLFAGIKRLDRIWKGFSRLDVVVLNSVFEPESHNYSCCPFCLKFSERRSGCMYMHHDCSINPGYYNVELYEKYKSGPQVAWCTVCGRPCNDHRHYAISSAEGPLPDYQPGFGRVLGDDCSPYGGGNAEKAMRFKALREKAWEIKDRAGQITESEAMNQLILAAWNAPLDPGRFSAAENLRARRWLEHPVENYPAPLPNSANVIVYPDIPVPPERQMPELVQGTNSSTFDDGDVLLFHHIDPETGQNFHETVNKDRFNKDSFYNTLETFMLNPEQRANFGHCSNHLCKAILYPIEVKTALELYGALTPRETAFCNKYRMEFNELFRKRRGGGTSEEFSIFRPLTDEVCLLPPKGSVKKSSKGGHRTRKNRKQYRSTRNRRK